MQLSDEKDMASECTATVEEKTQDKAQKKHSVPVRLWPTHYDNEQRWLPRVHTCYVTDALTQELITPDEAALLESMVGDDGMCPTDTNRVKLSRAMIRRARRVMQKWFMQEMYTYCMTPGGLLVTQFNTINGAFSEKYTCRVCPKKESKERTPIKGPVHLHRHAIGPRHLQALQHYVPYIYILPSSPTEPSPSAAAIEQ
jgi:hypothetical protein